MKKRYTKKEQQEHLENWEKGGMSKNAYALRAGINPRTFIGWTWQQGKIANNPQNFVEIDKAVIFGRTQDIVIEKNGITIRLPLMIGLKELQTVFVALGGLQ